MLCGNQDSQEGGTSEHVSQSWWLTDNDSRMRNHREAGKTASFGKTGLKILERQLGKWKTSLGGICVANAPSWITFMLLPPTSS